jgi:hypothetical protein
MPNIISLGTVSMLTRLPSVGSPKASAVGSSPESTLCAIMRCMGPMEGSRCRTLETAPSIIPSKAVGGGGGSSDNGVTFPPPQWLHAKPDLPENQCLPQ